MSHSGTFACPICGKDTQHTHSRAEIECHRETEAWVEAKLEEYKLKYPQFFPTKKDTDHA